MSHIRMCWQTCTHKSYRLSKWVGGGGRDIFCRKDRKKERERQRVLGNRVAQASCSRSIQGCFETAPLSRGNASWTEGRAHNATSHSASSTEYFTGAENNQPISNCQRTRKSDNNQLSERGNHSEQQSARHKVTVLYSPVLFVFGTI